MRIEIAKRVAEHMHKMPFGFPTAPNGDEYKILDYPEPMTDEEGELLAQLMPYGEHIDDIAERLGRDKDELIPLLDSLLRRGWLGRTGTKEEGYYRVHAWAPGSMEARWLKHLSKEFMEHEQAHMGTEATLTSLFGDSPDIIPWFRVLPHEAAIPHDVEVLPSELLSHIIDHVGDEGISAMDCLCRTMPKLGMEEGAFAAEACDRPSVDMCLMFGDVATTMIESGVGRAITKDEAMKILKKGRDAGLVYQTTTCEHVTCICQCCSCCCSNLRLFLLGITQVALKSNFLAAPNMELCNGCQACIKVCPTKALTLDRKTKKTVIEVEKCLGCGLCVISCPSEGAIRLKRKPKEQVVIYPHTWDDFQRIRAQQVGRTELMKMK